MAYDQNNLFAKIIRGEIPCNRVYENDEVLAFHDIYPQAPIHVLVIPKGEYQSFATFVQNAEPDTVGRFFQAVSKICDLLGCAETGYRLITNQGINGGQVIPHFHVHILAGKVLGPKIVR